MKRTHNKLVLIGTLLLSCSLQAFCYNADWQLIFNDEFAESSFQDGTLRWNEKWNKIDYVNWSSVSDWRKYQSRDNELVTPGSTGDIDYITLKGAYGDYTSQHDQTGSNDTFASGGIFTDKTFSFQYGYMEVRAQFESAKGCWPAIWLMPVSSSGWLPGGEIDIMEHINNESTVHQTLHLHNNAGTADAAPSKQTSINNQNGWHTYGVEWTPEHITFFVDGNTTNTITAANYTYWPFSHDNHEFYILIDQQIGGSWAGEANATTLGDDSVDFNIDYVRVYANAPNNNLTPQEGWDSEASAPTDAFGNMIEYTPVDDKDGGILDQATPGHYHFTIARPISHILAEQSHLKLTAENSSDATTMDNSMVQAKSLYVADGKYTLSGSATLDVDTLYLVGGSLEVNAAYALSSVKQLYLGMEDDAISNFAQRNASLYFTTNQQINADITFTDDSKMAVYQGNTLNISGNILAKKHTLNLVGVNSEGTAQIALAGQNNQIGRLSIGIAETTPAGNTFNGAGQILALQLTSGSHTEVGELHTCSPVAASPSSITIQSGAELTVTGQWEHHGDNNFHFHIEKGGLFNIAYAGTSTTSAAIRGSGTIRKTQNGQTAISTSPDFNGTVESMNGHLVITGSALFTEAAATGGDLTLHHITSGITVHTLRILDGNTLGAYTGSGFETATESTITITQALITGNGILNANLVLNDGVILDITTPRGITMGSSITLSGKAILGDTIISAFQNESLTTYTLATSLDSFITDTTAWTNKTEANAADYFIADGLDLNNYTLSYYWETPMDPTSGVLRITKNIPEPSFSTLSMLAVAILAGRRRRK